MTTAEKGPDLVARERHPAAIRWMHWVNFPLLFIMMWSGLRIYWADDVFAFGIGRWEWFHFFPDWFYERLGLNQRLARGIAFHFTFGWLFVANGLAYVAYLATSGEWRHLIPDTRALRDLGRVVAHDIGFGRSEPPKGRYNAAQQVAYTTVIGLGALIVVSGFAIYKPTQLSALTALLGGYQTARLIHFSTTIALALFFLVHVLQVVRAGWRNFVPMITGYAVEPREPTTPDTVEGESVHG